MAKELGRLENIQPREFILTHTGLSHIKDRCVSRGGNGYWFLHDLFDRDLKGYEGTFVAYQKGILCGQSENGKLLYDDASSYYGSSGLSVFRVPQNRETLEDMFKEDNMFGVADTTREVMKALIEAVHPSRN